jgi:hypothetical protein
MPEGQGFIDYAKQSALVKGIVNLGFFYETSVEREEKDYGGDEYGAPISTLVISTSRRKWKKLTPFIRMISLVVTVAMS